MNGSAATKLVKRPHRVVADSILTLRYEFLIIRDVTSCGLVDKLQLFRETCCLQLRDRRVLYTESYISQQQDLPSSWSKNGRSLVPRRRKQQFSQIAAPHLPNYTSYITKNRNVKIHRDSLKTSNEKTLTLYSYQTPSSRVPDTYHALSWSRSSLPLMTPKR